MLYKLSGLNIWQASLPVKWSTVIACDAYLLVHYFPVMVAGSLVPRRFGLLRRCVGARGVTRVGEIQSAWVRGWVAGGPNFTTKQQNYLYR